MSILIVNGSPKKGRNTDYLMELAIEVLKREALDFEVIDIKTMRFEGCHNCGYCSKVGYCFQKDDLTPIYKKIDESDGTIVLSPVFFDGVPGKLKEMIDRTQAFYASKYILKEPSIDRSKSRFGLLVSLAGANPYETQFLGNKLSLEFYLRCTNTKLVEHLMFHSLDYGTIDENLDYIKLYIRAVENLVEKIKG